MPKQETPSPIKYDDPLAIAAMILGAISFTGLGFLTGIPAIILASVALARKTPSRGLSIAGLVTGIVSTVVSMILVLLFILLIIFAPTDTGAPIQNTPTPMPAEPYSHGRV
jgi:hypothetical protein